MLLTGCNSAPAYVHTCPVAATYTAADKAEARRELDSIKDHSTLDLMLEDYTVLSKQSKDCWSK